jgi:RNA polymerase sigma factor (sigma-70 family)
MIDSAKFSAWFAAHAAAMTLYARQWVRDASAAEDVVHDAFVAVFAQASHQSWREPQSVRAWLFAVVRNRAVSEARTASRRRKRESSVSGVARDAISPFDSRLDDLIDARAAQAALDELPLEQRELIVLRIWGGLGFAEIAELTGLRPSTAFDRYRQALAVLRARLERTRCDTSNTTTDRPQTRS